MSSLLTRLRGGSRDIVSIDDYSATVNQYGLAFGRNPYETTLTNEVQSVGRGFPQLAAYAHGANGVVFSVMAARQSVFSSVRFRWQRLRDGKPSDLFGTTDLRLLETPWSDTPARTRRRRDRRAPQSRRRRST